jgi:hypothetical protein
VSEQQRQVHQERTEKALPAVASQLESRSARDATVAVRERPLLMSGPMVRAILDGTKTQTRRVILPQPNNPHTFGISPIWGYGCKDGAFYIHAAFCEDGQRVDRQLRCPYGQPGDRLWVRETFGYVTMHCLTERRPPRQEVVYRAGKRMGIPVPGTSPVEFVIEWRDDFAPDDRWRPSIHMPRRCSRLTLEITGVRVERVQDISEADAIAEGLLAREGDGGAPGSGYKWKGTGYHGAAGSKWGPTFHVQNSVGSCACKIGGPTPAQCAYRELWDSLNAKRGYGWDVNPWVWVLTFRRVTP